MLKLVVVGAGLIGRKHINVVKANKHCVLVGICDVDPNCRALADDHKVPFYQDLNEMLNMERPDGAIIATPNHMHLASVEACASYEVNMLVEKPISDSLENAYRMIELAEKSNVRLIVGHHRRHNPLVQQARSVVQDGSLGRLVSVSVLSTLYKPDNYFEVTWRRSRPGGGPALINLIHEIDNMRFICGEMEQVYAVTSSAIRGFEVEDTLSVLISFENGALGSMIVSDTASAPWAYELTTGENPYFPKVEENCYYFTGTLGSLSFPQMEHWHYKDKKVGWQYPLEKSKLEASHADPLEAQLEHFGRVIQGDETPLVNGQDAARSLAVVLTVLASAESHTPVHL
jgi:predicted dehydrogenase